MGKLFVTYLNENNEKNKTIKNYLDLIINTYLNQMSIRSCFVSQPRNKLISNSEQLFNATELTPISLLEFYLQMYAIKIQQILKIIQ